MQTIDGYCEKMYTLTTSLVDPSTRRVDVADLSVIRHLKSLEYGILTLRSRVCSFIGQTGLVLTGLTAV